MSPVQPDMRILAITNLFPNAYEPNRAAFNRHQLEALGRSHSLRVVAPIAWTAEAAHRLRRRGARLPQGRRGVYDGVTVDYPRFYFTPRILRNWYGHFYLASIRRRCRDIQSQFKPDLVLGTWAYPDGWAAVRIARSLGLPAVIKVHGCDVLCGGRGLESDPPRMKRTVDALREADGVIAVSRHLAERVEALGVDRRRIRTIYNGVDGDVFGPGPVGEAKQRLGVDPNESLVVFVGRLDPVKGIDVLLEACAHMVRRGIRFKCAIVGDGELRGQLTRQIAALALERTVSMVGGRPQRELGDWYRAADVVVAPSRSEGVPGVLLEAAACGAPFVATRVGGIPEIADMVPSQLVPAEDAAALAQAITYRLENPVPHRTRPPQLRTHDQSAQELAEFLEGSLEAYRQRRSPNVDSRLPDQDALVACRIPQS